MTLGNKMYNGISRDLVLEIHAYIINLRKKGKIGQRRLAKKIKERFNVEISESTISGWVHRNLKPYANEITQFKPKPIPSKNKLYNLYVKQRKSTNEIASKFNVAHNTALNWFKKNNFKIRSRIEAMNTDEVKEKLRNKKLTRPTKNYSKLTLEKSYILGVLAGDGYINNKIIRFEIRKDIEFIEEFSRCLKKVYGINYKYKYYKPRNSYVLYAASEIICSDLLKYGKFLTFSWSAPKLVMSSKDKKVIGNYLKGLYDSEGHVGKYDITFSSSSKEGVKDIKFLLYKLGIDSKIFMWEKDNYVLRIGRKENVDEFKKLVGFTIKRKMDRLK